MWTTKAKQGVFFAVAVLCVTSWFTVRFPLLGQESARTKSALTSLLEERRDVLKTRVEILEKLAAVARSTPEALIAGRADLFAAEYELANGSDQRIAVLQQKLENAKQLESLTQQRKLKAEGSEVEVLMATADRLGVEIELLKERGEPGKSR